MSRPECDRIRDLAPEIALGAVGGEERARALAHVRDCPDCRAELEALSRVADGLLLLAPVQEPAVGFESRVTTRLEHEGFRAAPATPQRTRWRRLAALAVAATLGAAATFGGVWLATGSQRELATFYERALAGAEGTYFGALPLEAPDGARVGSLFGYEGEPPWIFVLAEVPAPGPHRVVMVTEDGERLALGSFTATEEGGSFGTTLPVPLFSLQRVVLLDEEGDVAARAVAPPSS